VTQAGVLERIALELEAAALARDDGAYDHARIDIDAAGRRLPTFEPEGDHRERAHDLVTALETPLEGGGFRFPAACGGHPPPVVVDSSGAPRELDLTGTLLGVVEDPQIADHAVDLHPGDTLLLYTDGSPRRARPSTP
jgi:Stage II sporulation protein E (SpoIIE)